MLSHNSGSQGSSHLIGNPNSKAFSHGPLFTPQPLYMDEQGYTAQEPDEQEESTDPAEENTPDTRFVPPVPRSFSHLGLAEINVEELVLKHLLTKGSLSGREIADALCIYFPIIETILGDLKNRLLIAHKGNVGMGDFLYILTDSGQEKALTAREVSNYTGAAPVPFEDYLYAVQQQSIRNERPGFEKLKAAFADMIFDNSLFDTIGPAINSGRGLFLYGEPGNGKTTIAEKMAACFQNTIFIPKALWIEGQIVQLYDPQNHELPEQEEESLITRYDQRWIEIKRPTVVVGGELTMDALEIKYNPLLKVSEAPLQMKANCGIFLIDDFGRQRVSHIDLLNRWIVPLEKRVDYLVLPNGQKITVPFDELIIFSTNLDPAQLVDDAFLRRIPYKIHVCDPKEEHFRQIFQLLCPHYGITYNEKAVDYLIEKHYRSTRPFRGCQPRDLLEQIVNASAYRGEAPEMSPEALDKACQNYFAAMGKLINKTATTQS